MSSLPLKDSILDSYSQFFRKIISHHPLKEDLLQNLSNFQQIALSDNSNYLQTKTFISSIYNKSHSRSPKPPHRPSQSPPSVSSSLPIDGSLKVFTHEKMRYPFSLLTKFTYTPFKDYLIKNSISLPFDSSLLNKYSSIRELLPDSQNFYRALGLGLLEAFLIDQPSLQRVSEWYIKVFNKEIVLSTQIYPFGPEELRSTFCGYLRQIIQTREDPDETREAKKARNLLYQMDSKDTVFDIALVSFIKELIINKSDQAKTVLNDLESRLKSNDSIVIGDLLSEIPQIFGVNLIVQIIQHKEVTEVVYIAQGIDTKACPTLNILNEKQLSYQNFCVLNVDTLENELVLTERPVSAAHSRNNSMTRLQPTSSNTNTRTEKSYNSELKATFERIDKNMRPPQPMIRRGNVGGGVLEELGFQMRSISDKPMRSNSLRFLNEVNHNTSRHEEHNQSGYEKSIINEESSPNKELMTLSKILSGYLDPKQKNNYSEKSPSKHNTSQQYPSEHGVRHLNTPPKPKASSPMTSDLSPLLNLNLLPLHNRSSPNYETSKQDSSFKIETKIPQISNENIPQRPGTKPPMKSNTEEKKNEGSKLITMVPKMMSDIPLNPFSMNPFSSGPSNNMSGLAPMGQQVNELPMNRSKSGPKPTYNPTQTKRFSLNPLGFMGPSGDMFDKNKNFSRGNNGQEINNENLEGNIDRKNGYKPSANMSMGVYGQDYNERKMY